MRVRQGCTNRQNLVKSFAFGFNFRGNVDIHSCHTFWPWHDQFFDLGPTLVFGPNFILFYY